MSDGIFETSGPGERNAAPEGQAAEAGERVAFCQQCGKGLTNETVRRAGSAVYCEPCLVARLEGASPVAGSGAPAGGSAGIPGSGASATGWTPVNGPAGVPPGAPTGNEPSPWLAALLGLIPGVGAAYNGQYAKGLAHLVIFVVLDSLSNNVNGVFSLLVLAWIVYQAVDAYQTAKARKDGTPLPNAFALNEIGDRLGFGRNWPGSAARPVTSSTTAGWASATTAPAGTASASQGPAGGPNWAGYVPPTNFATATTAPPPPPPVQPTAYAGPASGSSGTWTQPPYTSTYAGEPWHSSAGGPVGPIPPMPPMPPSRRFPVGAAWLIALGLIFLLANLNASWRLGGSWIAAICLAALGTYLLFRRIEMVHGWSKMVGETDPLAAGVGPRLMCQIRGPVMLLVLALLFALQAAGIRTLGQTWGVLLIAFGALLILERTMGSSYGLGGPLPPHTPAADTRKGGQ
ncbi:MAG TPA: hypothetical protein VGU25_14220 [Acidobacteriaceae bacterium]|nr:hypothetical protein [Acidobacteriaceae bacterium]